MAIAGVVPAMTTVAADGTGAGRPWRGAEHGAPGVGRGRGPALITPEVKADRAVTFRFRALDAEQVTLIGELDGKTYPMTKDDAGVGSVTMGPWAPDVYNYQFNADGIVAMARSIRR